MPLIKFTCSCPCSLVKRFVSWWGTNGLTLYILKRVMFNLLLCLISHKHLRLLYFVLENSTPLWCFIHYYQKLYITAKLECVTFYICFQTCVMIPCSAVLICRHQCNHTPTLSKFHRISVCISFHEDPMLFLFNFMSRDTQ